LLAPPGAQRPTLKRLRSIALDRCPRAVGVVGVKEGRQTALLVFLPWRRPAAGFSWRVAALAVSLPDSGVPVAAGVPSAPAPVPPLLLSRGWSFIFQTVPIELRLPVTDLPATRLVSHGWSGGSRRAPRPPVYPFLRVSQLSSLVSQGRLVLVRREEGASNGIHRW